MSLQTPTTIRVRPWKLISQGEDASRPRVSSLDASIKRPTIVGLVVKPIGKPSAGNRHARFDERGWETERWPMAPSYRAHPRLYQTGDQGCRGNRVRYRRRTGRDRAAPGRSRRQPDLTQGRSHRGGEFAYLAPNLAAFFTRFRNC